MRRISPLCSLVAVLLVCGCGKSKAPAQPDKVAAKGAESKGSKPESSSSQNAVPPAANGALAAPSSASVVHAAEPVEAAEPLYFDRPLTPDDVARRPLRELSLIRNTIFARHGNTFVKPWLDRHFRSRPWYAPKPRKDWGKPSARDLANAKVIAEVESGLSAKQLDVRAAEVRARIAAKQPTAHDHLELRMLSARRGRWLGGDAVPKNKRTPLEDPTLLKQQLAVGQLDEMSRRDLRLLRNTIYALHGYKFRSEMLWHYFSSTDWYKANSNFSNKLLSAVDQRNLKLIRSVEDQQGGPLTDKAHAEAIGWMSGA
jgi:hypothetical protein